MLRIFVDSGSSIKQDEKKHYGVEIIPLKILLGDKEYSDGIDLSISFFYSKRLAQPHVVGQNPAEAEFFQRPKPPETEHLIIPHDSLQMRRYFKVGFVHRLEFPDNLLETGVAADRQRLAFFGHTVQIQRAEERELHAARGKLRGGHRRRRST